MICWQVLHLGVWRGLQGAQLFEGLQRVYVHPLIENHNQPACLSIIRHNTAYLTFAL